MKKEGKTKVPEKYCGGKDVTRVPTGIPGFDDLVEGGFPSKSSTLLCGGPGTGKTIFCLQYLINGAKLFNEKGLYVTFEQRTGALRDQSCQFGWNLEELEKKGMVTILAIPVEGITRDTITQIEDLIRKQNIKRLVIDSLSTLVINAPIYQSTTDLSVKDVVGQNVMFSAPVIGDYIVKRFIYGFIEKLREVDCTTILIGESAQGGDSISRDTLSEFACDGVIIISFESMGGAYSRSLIVRKMRHTKNDEDVHPVEISPRGLIVHKID